MTADGLALPESEVISQWICDEYSEVGPELKPEDPETRAICALATRIHDVYIVPIQGCMYRGPMDVKTRADRLAEVAKQLDVIEGAMSLRDGPFVAEGAVNRGRRAVPDVRVHRVHPPETFWVEGCLRGSAENRGVVGNVRLDACGARVYGEIRGGLESWESNGRWQTVGVTDAVRDASVPVGVLVYIISYLVSTSFLGVYSFLVHPPVREGLPFATFLAPWPPRRLRLCSQPC